jgi:uncharacterized protein
MRITVPALLATAAVLVAVGCAGSEDPGAPSAGVSAPDSSVAGELTALGAPSSRGVSGGPVGSGGGTPVEGITVVGNGSAETVPDVAEWSFGVQAEADTAEAALAAAGAAMERVLDALRSAGIDGDDLRTEQVSVYPRTSSDGRSVVGYDASNTVHVVVRDLSRAGAVVDAAVAAGANQVYGPTVHTADTRDAYQAAVKAAFADARAHAEAIAAEAGLQLGAPVAIVEGGGGGVIPFAADAAVESAEAAVPIEPGIQEVAVSLTVTFAVS